VSGDVIAAARRGEWQIVLTPTVPVPRAWFGELRGAAVLCLASGGGQQGPILSAAGARVTVLDNSPRQLAADRTVAEREGLAIDTVEGDMADLSVFSEASFDLVVNPVSTVFVPDVRPVWAEVARVLRPGGALIAGFTNPIVYIFDSELDEQGVLEVKYRLPYSDLTSLEPERRQRLVEAGEPLEFSHTLDDLIGGQLRAGLVLVDFFEDSWKETALGQRAPIFFATRAVKPPLPSG
jgi:SAM-dependent methyltransferase